METRPLGAELFHANERTDGDRHDEANILFSYFGERRLKKEWAKRNCLKITMHRYSIF